MSDKILYKQITHNNDIGRVCELIVVKHKNNGFVILTRDENTGDYTTTQKFIGIKGFHRTLKDAKNEVDEFLAGFSSSYNSTSWI